MTKTIATGWAAQAFWNAVMTVVGKPPLFPQGDLTRQSVKAIEPQE